MASLCGANCSACPWNGTCGGCAESGGRPFGERCVPSLFGPELEQTKEAILRAIRSLNIGDMEDVTDLYALRGAFINMEYPLPGGQAAKFWSDNKIYLGNQVRKGNSGRCYGVAADEQYLLICEYGPNGTDPELVGFLRWNTAKKGELP